ncbi:hypothetical protein SOVF_100000 [Spinacia oleracea]|uniref:Uncharacterized LOC110793887 n=1 Tax=Spinacia oleracea TaxID=3562 RepID=A0ABM2BIT8_SPIOL|nr:uncharacterized LOC110793887 [Spinacia oleracea]KNA15242.1 hypothetical protein SOVF_100000 [Spinacia oleracea]
MVKVRMNTADVAAEVKCLRNLIGMRCSNVYDISPKTYMFKLMNSSGITESGESEKVLLLIESGVRLHTTEYVRDKSNTPSGFTLKLRKHIRTKRLEDVRQLGYDRIIVFQFGLGGHAHYVILELYAQGNIVLTDSEFTVLTLLRSHRDDDKGFAIMSRHRYPIELCRTFERSTSSKLKDALAASYDQAEDEEIKVIDDGSTVLDTSKIKKSAKKGGKVPDTNKAGNDGSRAKQRTLKIVLGEGLGYGPQLSEHIILDAGLTPSMKVSKDNKLDEGKVEVLGQAVSRFEDWLEDVIRGSKVPEGYILMQAMKSGGKDCGNIKPESSIKIYDEYCPILLNQFKSRDCLKFETFDAALDEFYSKIESQRSEQQQKAKEGSAMQKLDKIRMDQENRVVTLRKEVEQSVKMAQLIEYNLEDVDAAILAVRVALANGMNWEDLARMVKQEKKSGNPVAGLIDKLYLEKNCMTLLLSNNLDDMDDDEKTLPADKVEVDLSLTAHGNARRWYDMKKKQENKQDKTITAHEKAFKAAERKTRLQLSKEKAVATISHMRKVHWFEKFNWFISSENYLVISGRDAQQNEMVVKRYMSKGDLYVHADMHGASTTVIKNHKPEQPVPPLTLNQAGCYTVCLSKAWDSKIVTSAWWVYPHQVSKSAPTGEYLTVGSFMIRGKKNFLPPHPLIMGFGMLFRVDESSLGLHLNERRVRGEDEALNVLQENGDMEIPNSDSESEATDHNFEKDNNRSIPSSTENHSAKLGGLSSHGSAQDDSISYPKAEVLEETGIESNSACSVHESKGKNNTAVSVELEDLIDRALELGSGAVSGRSYEQTLQLSKSEEFETQEKTVSVKEKPHVSKAERKKLKKGQKTGDEQDIDVQGEEDEGHSSTIQPEKKNSSAAGGKVARGKRGKLKKMKEKYADQDEEERSIRMTLLASAGKALDDKKENDAQDQKVATSTRKELHGGSEDALKICYKCKKAGHLSRECPEHPEDASRAHRNGRLENPDGDSAITASEMEQMAMEEDDIHEIGEEEKEKLNDVDYLTGNPLPNDVLLYAVPVCGPYNALQTYKYRVKIVPGTAKKGKAAKTAMNLFNYMPDASNREKELMKACTDPELVAAMVGNSKITAAGLSQLKQKQKKGKKAASKAGS